MPWRPTPDRCALRARSGYFALFSGRPRPADELQSPRSLATVRAGPRREGRLSRSSVLCEFAANDLVHNELVKRVWSLRDPTNDLRPEEQKVSMNDKPSLNSMQKRWVGAAPQPTRPPTSLLKPRSALLNAPYGRPREPPIGGS